MSPNGASTLFCVQSGEGSNTDMVSGVSMLLCHCHVMMGIFLQFRQIRTQSDVHFILLLRANTVEMLMTPHRLQHSTLLVAVAYVESCSVAMVSPALKNLSLLQGIATGAPLWECHYRHQFKNSRILPSTERFIWQSLNQHRMNSSGNEKSRPPGLSH